MAKISNNGEGEFVKKCISTVESIERKFLGAQARSRRTRKKRLEKWHELKLRADASLPELRVS